MLYEKTEGRPGMTEPVALTCAYVLDLLIGDPRFIPHPVRGIGWAIGKTERVLRKKAHPSENMRNTGYSLQKEEKRAGLFLVVIVVGLTYLLFHIVNSVLMTQDISALSSYVSFIVFVYLVSTTIATRDLILSVQSVRDAVNDGRIEDARDRLGMIVGRDTGSLDDKGILKAAIETLSENASDGIVAPLCYFAIGGLPLAMAYKAINTLDSMVGYRNDTYRNFGWASAKLDDIANYIPARITGMLIIGATYIIHAFRHGVHEGSKRLKKVQNRPGVFMAKLFSRLEERTEKADFEESLRAFEIMRRDGRKHSSPNSGIPEAAMAGALGVQLGGPSIYKGRIIEKPYIGREFQHREAGAEYTDGFYVRATQKAISITKIVSLSGLLIAILICYMRAAL